jgi:hypothetical protein
VPPEQLRAGNVDALSWAAVLVEIAGAIAFGAVGLYALRRQSPAEGATPAQLR